LEDYRLDYLLDGNAIKQYPLAGKGATSENIKIVFDGLTEGAHDLYVRAVSGGGLTSNYIQISFIY
jgi:hypothetical protein